MTTRLSAQDLRHGLLIGTQPGMRTEDGLLRQHQVEHLRKFYIDECHLTRRRFDHAADMVQLDSRIRTQLTTALFA